MHRVNQDADSGREKRFFVEQGQFRSQCADDAIATDKRLRGGFAIARVTFGDVSPGSNGPASTVEHAKAVTR